MITLINCFTKPLMSLGINGFHDLTSANKGHIISGKQLTNKKISTSEFSKSTL